MPVLFLGISVTFWAGCSSRCPDPCAWVKPIQFQDETKAWLNGLDWPSSAYEDFEEVAKHNDKVRVICK